MSVYESNRAVPLGASTTHSIVAIFERALASFSAWRNARATESELSELSDKQLADIGLHRGEISAIAEHLAHN